MSYKALYIFFLLAVLSCTSCEEKEVYENTRGQEYYWDSLLYNTFLDSIQPISFSKMGMFDTINFKNPYLKEGSQIIHLYSELRKASELKKPVLIYFTAYGCKRCREFEEIVLKKNKINSFIKKEFEFIPLCVNDRTQLPESHWLENPLRKEHTKGKRPFDRIGDINNYVQIVLTSSCGNPLFVTIDENRKLGVYDNAPNPKKFMAFLKASIENYNKK